MASRTDTKKTDPKRMRIMLAVVGVLILATLYVNVLSGGEEDLPPNPGVPTPGMTTPGGAPGASTTPASTTPAPAPTSTTPADPAQNLPADPTAPKAPTVIRQIPKSFPGTGPVVVRYNPFKLDGAAPAAGTTPGVTP